MEKALPEAIQYKGDSKLPKPVSEDEALERLRQIGSKNRITQSFIGQGYYGTRTPGVIKRNVLENPSWYTAYTPYQPEISQGRLEALINFQTMVTDLTGMTTANASMLDESTAVVEAMLVAKRNSKSESNIFFADEDLFPQTKSLLEHRAEPLNIVVRYFDAHNPSSLDEEAFGCVVQYPGATGRIPDFKQIADKIHELGGMAIATADLMAMTLITPPGELGADVVCGTTQRFGVPMGFGGPHAGYLAVRQGLERTMPGRLVGVSVDAEGAPAYRLTLQTREQHIRREKATSNICTAQVLLAVMAGMYAVYHGPNDLKAIGQEIHDKASALAKVLAEIGIKVHNQHFFDTIRISSSKAKEFYEAARSKGLTMLKVDDETLGISLDESTTWGHLAELAAAFGARAPKSEDAQKHLAFERTSEYLQHPVFNTHHSETAMLRYLKRLGDYDYALDRGMIPLGSCTMKLNSVTEMEAVTWPEFASLHPFAPAEDTLGYQELIAELSSWLSDITGYEAVSLQPNAGSQGELAGLLAIRGYHRSRGDYQRNLCLIPSSAHGTNAASAVLAGMEVVVVNCDENGNVDLGDLKLKIIDAGEELAALMITYPSTHGVYEEAVVDICDMVHAAGGQVYIDGANTNAVVGFAKFGEFGGDVSHLNLHKTFAIPHGGGGPGVGPVVARPHLKDFLPGHSMSPVELPNYGPISAAPFGSASILPISWAYIQLLGTQGLMAATSVAVLSANYVAKRLAKAYPLLYTGKNDLVAHEAIIDIRPLQKDAGISNDDVAKRLVDFGFHAPTMSFPVAGTLMIEPTESEPKEELDRFVDAMIAIHAEAMKVQRGEWPAENNPLVNAPHTARHIAGDWDHPYSREEAAYPQGTEGWSKYWPKVRRIDGAFGDRNLTCTCPPIESFAKN